MLIIFDEMIMNSNLRQVWPIYCKSMKSMRKNLSHFGNEFSTNSLDGIESVLDDLDWLFEGKAFQVSVLVYVAHSMAIECFFSHFLRNSLIILVKSDPNSMANLFHTSLLIC
jgi:hypothetical protein